MRDAFIKNFTAEIFFLKYCAAVTVAIALQDTLSCDLFWSLFTSACDA